MNSVFISGNLTADPQGKIVSNNVKLANFTVAVSDRNGPNKEKTTSFIDVTAWNKTAEIIIQHFVKGSMLSLAGHLKQESYEDKNGNKISKIRIVADEVLNIPARNRSVSTSIPTADETITF